MAMLNRPRDDRPPVVQSATEPSPASRIEEALLILSRMLGRQAARDWLSADIGPPELADDE